MNRKLHNSLTALLFSGAALAGLLLIASPAESWPTESAERTAHQTEAATQGARVSAHAVRQSIRIPFFSFSPRS